MSKATKDKPHYSELALRTQEKYKPFFDQMQQDSQTYQILLYMLKHGEITPVDAFFDKNIGSLRLSARIADLRSLGVPIKTTMRTLTSEKGATRTFAVYTIESEV